MRRIFYALFALVVILALGVAVYIFFFSKKDVGDNLSPDCSVVSCDPFGRAIDRIERIFIPREQTATSSLTEVITEDEQPLVKVWDKPVAGFTFIEKPTLIQVGSTTVVGSSTFPSFEQVRGTSTHLLFMDRTTGYTYSYTDAISQISNTLIPGVYDAYFFASRFVIVRSFSEDRQVIISTLYKIPETSVGNVSPLEKVRDLPNNITSISVREDGRELAYIVKNTVGATIYTLTSDLTGSSVSLPFSEWVLGYSDKTLYATSKASYGSLGYTVEVFSGRRIISSRYGLTTKPHTDDTLFIFNAINTNGSLSSSLFERQTGQIKLLPIKTLSVKCSPFTGELSFVCGVPSLLPRGFEGLPDDWYQGTVSFSDSLYLVSGESGEALPLLSLSQTALEDIDLTDPDISFDDNLFSFINKKNGSLWLAKLYLLR